MTNEERLRQFAIEYVQLKIKYGVELAAQIGLAFQEFTGKNGPKLEVAPTGQMSYQLIPDWQEPPPPEAPFGLTTEQILAVEPFIAQARAVSEARQEAQEDQPSMPSGKGRKGLNGNKP